MLCSITCYAHRVKSDLLSLFPFEDICVVIKVNGSDIIKALENGVRYVQLNARLFAHKIFTLANTQSLKVDGRKSVASHSIGTRPNHQEIVLSA